MKYWHRFALADAIWEFSTGMFVAYWIIFLLKLGFAYWQVALAQAIFTASMLAFQLPVGAIADTIGRKRFVVSGFLLEALLFICLAFAREFWQILAIYSLWGYASAAMSLTRTWLTDEIKFHRETKKRHEIFGKVESITSVGFFLGPLTGGFLSFLGLKTLPLIVGITLTPAVILLGVQPENYVSREKITRKLRFAFRHLIKNKPLVIFLLAAAFSAVGFELFYMTYQPRFDQLNIPLSYYGYCISLIGLVDILTMRLSPKFASRFGGEARFLGLLYLLSILPPIFLLDGYYLALLSLVLYGIIYDLAKGPAFSHLFHSLVPSRIRATSSSLLSIVTSVGAFLAEAIFGLADIVGLRFVIGIGIPFLIGASACMCFLHKNSFKPKSR